MWFDPDPPALVPDLERRRATSTPANGGELADAPPTPPSAPGPPGAAIGGLLIGDSPATPASPLGDDPDVANTALAGGIVTPRALRFS